LGRRTQLAMLYTTRILNRQSCRMYALTTLVLPSRLHPVCWNDCANQLQESGNVNKLKVSNRRGSLSVLKRPSSALSSDESTGAVTANLAKKRKSFGGALGKRVSFGHVETRLYDKNNTMKSAVDLGAYPIAGKHTTNHAAGSEPPHSRVQCCR